MRRRHALLVAVAAALSALAIVALPALAGAQDGSRHGDHRRGDDHGHHHGHHGNHGDRDRHENVGRISAFDTGTGELTIARFGGGTISGLVTNATEIKCEGADDSARFSRDGGSGSSSGPGSGDEGGSNSGPGSSSESGRGEEEPGDDRGEGLEPGDDHGGRGEEEPGDDHGDRHDGDRHDDRICTTAALTVGTVVDEVDRNFVNGVATFDEIELGHTS